MLPPEIATYYRGGIEQHRLDAGAGRLEFLRTMDILDRVLPGAPADVLDVGGATDVYAGPLADAGYRVLLVDLLPEHVAEASARPGVTAMLGDARALPVPDASADAVLLLGPLYHLLGRADRVAARREAWRAARPGGIVVGATINRFASLIDGVTKNHASDPLFRVIVDNTLADGVHRNIDDNRRYFTSAYFHHHDEIAAEVADAGLTLSRRIAVEGPLWIMGERLDDIYASAERTGHLLNTLRRIEEEPSLFGAGSHLLTVAHR
jgi:SAM-dependent methyltransferase